MTGTWNHRAGPGHRRRVQRPRQGGVALAAEARGWRPRWWTSGRREVEAAPRVERTSGLGGSGTPALLGVVFLSGVSLK